MRSGSLRAADTHADAGKRRAVPTGMADIERLGVLLDARFRIPGTGIRFGLDSLIGLVPGVGDTATALIGLYIVLRARALGASRWTQARMVGNVLVDMVIGAIPLVGDIFDVAYKSNLRNVRLLQRSLGDQPRQ